MPLLLAALSIPCRAEMRIVAVGDVHGDFPDFVVILQKVGLIDANHQWSGSSAILVQTGDIPDRGPQSRAAFDLVMQLEPQAEKQNGKVIAVLGNHEVMNMIGDLRYVSVEDYRTFSTDQSEKVREDAFQDYRKFLSAHRGHRHTLPGDDEAGRQKWMAAHPPGFFEQRDAFAPKGVYGRWLRKHDAVGEVEGILFMHGGLDPKLHFRNVRELNDHIRSELAAFDTLWETLCKRKIVWRYMTFEDAFHQVQEERAEMQSGGGMNDSFATQDLQKFLDLPRGMLMATNSPLWYRGYALEPEEKLKKDLDAMMARLKVRYIVAGHTVRPKYSITTHFDNHVFLIDTGMLKAYFGGRASALEIQNGRFTAQYADGPDQVLLAPPGGAAVPASGHGNANGEHKP